MPDQEIPLTGGNVNAGVVRAAIPNEKKGENLQTAIFETFSTESCDSPAELSRYQRRSSLAFIFCKCFDFDTANLAVGGRNFALEIASFPDQIPHLEFLVVVGG